MSLLHRVSTLISAGANEAVDKAIDHNSIPVVKQEIRDLEVKQSEVTHFAAAADANVTIINNQITAVQKDIDHNTAEAKAAKAQGDIPTATAYAQKVVDAKGHLETLNQQLENAKTNAQHMNDAAAQVTARHDALMTQLRSLEAEDQQARALNTASAGLKVVQDLTDSVDGPNVDNLAQHIHEKSVTAQAEFDRTAASFKPTPVDPLANAAATDLLASL
jgi:phage shock protein A